MSNTKKGKVLILCEGPTDIAFLYIILKKWFNCEYIDKKYQGDIGLISFDGKNSDDFSWYENDNFYFHVCCVGGCGNFLSFYDKNIAKKINDDIYYNYFIIIRDRDNHTNDELRKEFNNFSLKMIINEWTKNECTTWSNDVYILNTYLCIIPTNDEGTLENIILSSLSSEKDIVDSAIKYVDGLGKNEKRYLIKKRDCLKAKVGITFTLISPQSTFSSFTSRIDQVDINNGTIYNNYSFLKKFV